MLLLYYIILFVHKLCWFILSPATEKWMMLKEKAM